MRFGILGGTFNPIHVGHLVLARVALEEMNLDKVIFVPCFLSPHKNGKGLVGAKERFEMVKLAVKKENGFAVSDFEVKRSKKSYSYQTVRHFKQILPKGTKLFFLVGQDHAKTLSSWKNYAELKREVTFVVVNRGGLPKITASFPAKHLRMPALEISATDIRQRIARGKSVKYLLPEILIKYIHKKKLYGS